MRVRLKGVNHVRKRLADGTWVVYYYAWKGGPRLIGEPGSPEFVESYNSAHSSDRRKPKNDLQWLIDEYLSSSDFLTLKHATKRTYLHQIKKIEAAFGDLPIAALADRSVRGDFLKWRDTLGATAPRQADLALRVLQRILSWGYDRALTPANPCERIALMYHGTRRDVVWTAEQEKQFMEKATPCLRLALQLALRTAQRKGDLLRLTWGSYDGNLIKLKQSKGGARVAIPVGATLKGMLDNAYADAVQRLSSGELREATILSTPKGTSWSEGGFTHAFKRVCKDAGVEGVTFHDLRGTVVMRLAQAGCSVPQIATVTGHSLNDVGAILDAHYFRRDSALAFSAIEMLEKAGSQLHSQLHSS